MVYDLILRHARLHRQPEPVDIAVEHGRFARISPDLAGVTAAREIEVAGRLVVPPFIDAHVHLDAVLTVGQPRYNSTGTLLEGIQIWSERKPGLTHEDVKRRALEEDRGVRTGERCRTCPYSALTPGLNSAPDSMTRFIYVPKGTVAPPSSRRVVLLARNRLTRPPERLFRPVQPVTGVPPLPNWGTLIGIPAVVNGRAPQFLDGAVDFVDRALAMRSHAAPLATLQQRPCVS